MKVSPPQFAHLPRKRNRYFTGKFMTAEDFATDPEYLLAHHRLHQQLAHDWGVLTGLEVVPHPDPACRPRFVVILPGAALDSQGRELLLEKPLALQVADDVSMEDPAVVFLCYREKAVEPVPTLYAEEGQVPQADQPGKILEGVATEAVPLAHLEPGEWPAWGDAAGTARVPLAKVSRGIPDDDCRPQAVEIDGFGRRQIGPPSGIEWVSWPHGGQAESPTVLELRFSSPLARNNGLDPYTFIVEEGAAQSQRRPVRGLVEISDDRRRARFVFTELATEDDFVPFDLFITLKCDFILDHHGRPIDGGHLGGRLPTRRGIPGGLFESWFRVVPPSPPDAVDHDFHPAQEEPCHE